MTNSTYPPIKLPTYDDDILPLEEAVRKYGPGILCAEGVSTYRADEKLSFLSGELCGSVTVYIPAEVMERMAGVKRAVDERDRGNDVVLVYAARPSYKADEEMYPSDLECGVALDTQEGREYVFRLDDLWFVHRMRRKDLPPAIRKDVSYGFAIGIDQVPSLIGAPPVFESKELDEHPTAGPQSDASPSTSEAA